MGVSLDMSDPPGRRQAPLGRRRGRTGRVRTDRAATGWVAERATIEGCAGFSDDSASAVLGELAADDTWRNVRRELDRMHLITMAASAGQIAQGSATVPGRQTVLRALDLPAPPRFLDFTVPDSR